MGRTSIQTLEENVSSAAQALGGGEIATCIPATRGNPNKVFTIANTGDLKRFFGKSSGAEYDYVAYLLGRGNLFRVVRAPVTGGAAATVTVPFGGTGTLGMVITAKGVGTGGNSLKAILTNLGGEGKDNLFSLAIFDGTESLESFGIVSLNPESVYYFGRSVKSDIIELSLNTDWTNQTFWTGAVTEITKELTGGTDGTVNDSYATALALLENREISFATLFLPLRTPAQIATEAFNLLKAREDFVLVHDAPYTGTTWTKITFASDSDKYASYVAGYCPKGSVQEFAGVIPASVGVVDLIAKLHERKLWYKSPAGLTNGLLSNFIDVEKELTAAEIAAIQDKQLNPLVIKSGAGVVIWNDVTEAESPLHIQSLATRILVNYFKRTVYALSQRFMFADHNEFTWTQWKNSVEPIIRDVYNVGGLNGYEVRCDRTTMTPQDIASGIMRGQIKIWPISHVREIIIKFTVDETGVSFE